MKSLGWCRLQEARLALALLAAIGVAACFGKGPQQPVVTPVPQAPPAQQVAWAAYVVQPGDTLGRIAACSGIPLRDLARFNGIVDPDVLVVGDRLRLPREHRCAAPIRAARPKTNVAERSDAVVARAEGNRLLDAGHARNDAADFEGALALAERCTGRLAPYARDRKAGAIRARCHVLAGMAAAGLERRERAIEEFRRAFALDPDLELSAQSSPRILELAEEAGRERAASR